MSAATSFCPECGTENPADVQRCTACGRGLDPLAELERASKAASKRKLRGDLLGAVAGVAVGWVVLTSLLGLGLDIGVDRVVSHELERETWVDILVAPATLFRVFGGAIGFALAGLVAAAMNGGRYFRELVFGVTAGVAAQLTFWLVRIKLAGGGIGDDLWIVGEGFVMRGPALVLLAQLLLLALFSGLIVAFFGWVLREALTGTAVCVHCNKLHGIRPTRPARCPHCDAEQERDGVQWGAVLLAGLISTVVFGLILALLREPLGIALECVAERASELSAACQEARKSEDFTIFRVPPPIDSSFFEPRGIEYWAVDKWRFQETGAIVMFIATFALALTVKRGARASAGALIPLYWLASSFVVMVVLADLGGSEQGFVFLLRLQVIALLIWGVVGALGVLLGDKLRYRKGSAYLDEIE